MKFTAILKYTGGPSLTNVQTFLLLLRLYFVYSEFRHEHFNLKDGFNKTIKIENIGRRRLITVMNAVIYEHPHTIYFQPSKASSTVGTDPT